MKVGITGATGFLGFHLRAALRAMAENSEVICADRNTFKSKDALDAFVADKDVVVHLAGVNRGNNVEEGNLRIADELISALRRSSSTPALAYANSMHFDRNTEYGRSKRVVGDRLAQWSTDVGARFGNFVIPHVFGEFGRPFHNSVTSTFCYQLAKNEEPLVQANSTLELLHAQDVSSHLLAWMLDPAKPSGIVRLEGYTISVRELLTKLKCIRQRYVVDNVVPGLFSAFDLALFNTFRSYLFPNCYPRAIAKFVDARGELFEAIRTDNCGQVFFSSTASGVTRGEHWHLRKVERFIVTQGDAVIRVRRLFADELMSFSVCGDTPVFIDIPTMHVHSITNVGSSPLHTLFWANEIFDPTNSDTYPERIIA